MKILLLLLFSITVLNIEISAQQQELTATEIIKKADERIRGESSGAEITMTVVRPTWKRVMTMKSWSKGDDLALILITAPARDAGTASLKRDKELWNWQPTIDRVIKLPPSMMLQSWMGSDFTNDDLVKESSILKDYTQHLAGDSIIDNRICYKIELIPKEDAPVVWGKVITWISKDDFIQLLTMFFDEDGFLINIMSGKNIKEFDGRLLPSRLEMVPVEKEGNMTILEYYNLRFDTDIDDQFFSIQNMKNVR